MPANLSPEYMRLEARLRETREPSERLAIMREMLTVIPKHKGTEKMQADLKRRISKLEEAAAQRRKRGGRDLFHVPREGAGQVILAGPPNAGKSTLLAALTHATPQVANYPFTTHLPQPGMVQYEDVQIQLIDAPPLSIEYTETALFNSYRVSDLICFVVDLSQPDPESQLRMCREMLEEHFIRVNPDAPRRTAGSESTIEKRSIVFANKTDIGSPIPPQMLEDVLGKGTPVFAGSAGSGDRGCRSRLAGDPGASARRTG